MRHLTFAPAFLTGLLLVLFTVARSAAQPVKSVPKAIDSVHEGKYISINGIEQWVTIDGNPSKPAILFVHGGPGSTISPYPGIFTGDWKKNFLLVQWDQRGAGRTYGRNAPGELTPEYITANPLSVDQILSDGIELTEFLVRYLGKKKVILFGTSWGSVVGAKMALKRPDLFQAYIGHSQVVNASANSAGVYQTVMQLASAAKDQRSLEVLETLGKPPYNDARATGKLIRIVKKYENERSVAPPKGWFIPGPEYDNAKDEQHRSDGDDFSFVHYAGDKRFGLSGMASAIDLSKHNNFKVPVYIIQGENDILTPKQESKKYFDMITAPKKKYYLVPEAAHGFNQAVIDKLYEIAVMISR